MSHRGGDDSAAQQAQMDAQSQKAQLEAQLQKEEAEAAERKQKLQQERIQAMRRQFGGASLFGAVDDSNSDLLG